MEDVISLVALIGVCLLFVAMAVWGLVILRKVPGMTLRGALVIDEDEDLATAGVMKPGRYHLEVVVPSYRVSEGVIADTQVNVRYTSRTRAAEGGVE